MTFASVNCAPCNLHSRYMTCFNDYWLPPSTSQSEIYGWLVRKNKTTVIGKMKELAAENIARQVAFMQDVNLQQLDCPPFLVIPCSSECVALSTSQSELCEKEHDGCDWKLDERVSNRDLKHGLSPWSDLQACFTYTCNSFIRSEFAHLDFPSPSSRYPFHSSWILFLHLVILLLSLIIRLFCSLSFSSVSLSFSSVLLSFSFIWLLSHIILPWIFPLLCLVILFLRLESFSFIWLSCSSLLLSFSSVSLSLSSVSLSF